MKKTKTKKRVQLEIKADKLPLLDQVVRLISADGRRPATRTEALNWVLGWPVVREAAQPLARYEGAYKFQTTGATAKP